MEATDLIRELEASREQVRTLSARITDLLRENEELRQRMDRLCRRLYGKKAEHVDAAQLALAFAQIEKEAEAEGTATPPPAAQVTAPEEPDSGEGEEAAPAPATKKPGHGRKRIPDHLPRRRVEHLPAPEDCVCSGCKKPMVRIGEEVSEQIDFVPASFVVIEHVRPKYACSTCKEGVVVAPVPDKVVEKGLAAAGLMAQVATAKFADHIPLARQEGIYAREGVDLPRSTLLGIVNQTAALLEPIAKAIQASVLTSKAIHADETPVQVKTLPSGSRQSYLWIYRGDKAEVVFKYTPTRSGDGPKEVLKHFAGYLQVDAYSGYDCCFAGGKIIEVGCMAHARRKVFEALDTDPEPASMLLALISKLYDVERDAKGLTDTERRALREVRSRPLLNRIGEKVAQYSATALPKGPLGKALTYITNQWAALQRYLEAGFLEIDNNAAERAIRPVAIGRNNWILAGSDDGARRAATLYTIVGTCKLQGIDPFEYMRDVLGRLSTTPVSRVQELTPRGWKAAREAVAAKAAAA